MKVAFISANQEHLPDPSIPLGVLYVRAACEARHETVLWDLCFEDDTESYLRERLASFRPDVIAVGLRNIQANDYGGIENNVAAYRALMACLRSLSDAPIVLGGAGFSVMPRELMATLEADYGISGEGERAMPELLEAIAGDRPLDEVGSLHRWVDGRLVSQPAGAWVDLTALPKPDRSSVDPRYYRYGGIESLQTKRGCPLRCTYCTYPTIEGRTHRLRPPDQVADEMVALIEAHPQVSHAFIVDSVFNLPPRHAMAVCDALIERGSPLPWTAYINPLAFRPDLAERMAAAGAVGMEIGSDSGTDAGLQLLKKGFDTNGVRKASRIAQDAGLKDCHTFVLGTPGEELDDVRRSLDFVHDLDPFCAIVMVWTDDAAAFSPEIAAQRAKLHQESLALVAEAAVDAHRWVVPQLALRFDEVLFDRLRRRGMRGPLWQHIHLSPPVRRRSGRMTA